jgi:RimJ/RimL family protein N-acetyltransferase
MIKIETERILLREFTLEDCEAVFEFSMNKEVQKYTGDITLQTVNQAKDIIKNVWFSDYKKYGYGRWAVVYKPVNKVIGFAGLKYLPELDETDIGYRFLPEYWGKGIATEVSKEIIKYGFEVLKLKKIIGITMTNNIASSKVLEKIGLGFYKYDSYKGEDENEKYNWYKITKDKYFNN